MKIHASNIVVDIEKVSPNDYNPKPDFRSDPKLEAEFNRIVHSLEVHGQMDPIQVREVGEGYEIINGYHRYEAARQLGWTEIEVKNLGKIDRYDAIAKTLTFEETGLPLDHIEKAVLVKEMQEQGIDLDILPYTPAEIQEQLDRLEFDFDQYAEQQEKPVSTDDLEVNETFTFTLECVDQLQADDIQKNLDTLRKRRGFTKLSETLQIILHELVTQDADGDNI